MQWCPLCQQEASSFLLSYSTDIQSFCKFNFKIPPPPKYFLWALYKMDVIRFRQHVGRLYRLETSQRCKCWKDLALRICCRWDDGSEGTSLSWPLIVFHLKGPPGCILAQLEGQMRPVFRAGWCKVSGFYKAPYINLITVGFSIFLRCLSRDGHSFSQKDAFYGAAGRWRAASVCSADFNCLSVAVKVSVKYTTVKRAAGPEPSASWETEMN